MNKTSIEWTHRPETGGAAGGFTWNPIRAGLDGMAVNWQGKRITGTFCTRISPGCTNCYASVINKRFGNGLEYTVPNLEKVEFYIDEKILAQPLQRKKPATIFVGDMFDLFHEAIPLELISEVLVVCGKAKQHTFQILTKRAARMQDIVSGVIANTFPHIDKPPANIWWGVSVESQKYADERIPLLLQTPAAVRFLSVEPMLEEMYLNLGHAREAEVDWVICGGESGPGARMFRREWAESLRDQCAAAKVAFFMKQFGSYPVLDPRYDQTISGASRKLRDRKGGDMEEWPESLRVREFPSVGSR